MLCGELADDLRNQGMSTEQETVTSQFAVASRPVRRLFIGNITLNITLNIPKWDVECYDEWEVS